MGHDEDKNNFNGGINPVNPVSVTPNPRAQFTGNRIGMRQARTFNSQDELERISTPTPQMSNITGGAAKKKSPMKLIVVLLVLTMLVAGGAAIFLSIQKKNSGNGIVSNNVLEKFNDFAKVYLGEDVSFDEEYSMSTSYAVDEAIEEGDDTFFEKAEEKYDDFISAIEESQSEEIKNAIKKYDSNFSFSFALGENPIPSEDSVVKKYLSSGKEATSTYIKNAFESLIDPDYAGMTAASNEQAYYLAWLDLIDYYRVNGCMADDGSMDEGCITNKNENGEVANLYNALEEAEKKRQSIMLFFDNSKRSLWEINKVLNGKDKQ